MNSLVSTIKGNSIGFNAAGVFIAWLMAQLAVLILLLISTNITGWQVPVLRLLQGTGFLGLLAFITATSFCFLWAERTMYLKKYGFR